MTVAKDYVRRGQGSKKTSRKKPNNRTKFPWKAGLLALLAVGAFGYGLYILSNDPEPKVKVTQPAPKKKPVTKTKPLPPPPKEEWEYVKELPNKEIEVQAKEQVVSEIPYIMQCGAFKTLQQAEERKVNIAFQGLGSKIRKKENSSWYRVVLGPYTTKREAVKDKHRLQRAKIEPCAIWKEAQ
ncbi:cell division protein FtsN [Vibrio albus]|uniref:Cell division protein FtsN n=1 Tax=Vibrio albus TaxID=2200953 RepID=A0A2U3BA96_9VIBR|nr:SPOR domain-containing protein [Vibrio albus]PWI33720.1 cell division protein FtsN [Vibrio albus]